MDSTTTITAVHHHQRSSNKKEKIIVIMGATGTGKSKLSIHLATRFNAEIINSDKIQLYTGLDITTNKIPFNERQGIEHHLLGDFDPEDAELTASEFRSLAGFTIGDIVSRKKLPFLVGGSNSLIHGVLVDRFNPEEDVFDTGSNADPVSFELRYNCCFLWVDVSLPLLCDYLSKRVDDMIDAGMFEELTQFYQNDPVSQIGLTKSIGVPEFRSYFRRYPPSDTCSDEVSWDWVRRGVYEEAVRDIKKNTCQLARRQTEKILRLRKAGWDLHRLDATEAIRRAMTSAGDGDVFMEEWGDIWERQVVEPSVKIVKSFLEE
ncbi:IPPT domain-containing protein [Cephalotus follicularis]|uniref:IPPT domain-containing protein n=1 Tax=Cephalotus follicularis TaxID=3775 RepID=A0A1Q3BEP3_CEPFO|nr:IPPT domain-containing protein [Cephalotus follicularis]